MVLDKLCDKHSDICEMSGRRVCYETSELELENLDRNYILQQNRCRCY